jgi:VWFA-related protein
VEVEAVTQDVVVKDERGLFVPDLKQTDFEIYEDGVKHQIRSMTMVYGGRVTNLLEGSGAPPPEGLILPSVKRTNDQSGRIFVFFVDDLHIQFSNTARLRSVFKRMEKELVHDGDLVGMVSSGPAAISVDLTYDRKRFDDAIGKMSGAGLRPDEIINLPKGQNGPTEVQHRAHVALKTMADTLENLDKVHNRRKALVWVSEGYDFIPFQAARLGMMDPDSGYLQNNGFATANQGARLGSPCVVVDPTCQNLPFDPKNPSNNHEASQTGNEVFADAELATDLLEITRAANRVNATIYTIDPRGLAGTTDMDQPVEPKQWNEYHAKTQNTLRALAEQTGGVAVVNTNNFDPAFKQIDNDTSDYYVLGYTSSNLDPTRRRRNIEVRVLRNGATVTMQRKEYVMRAPQAGVPPVADVCRRRGRKRSCPVRHGRGLADPGG